MKKNLLYVLALATVMVACDNDDYTDWANAQANPAETAQTVNVSTGAASDIDFANLTEGQLVQIFVPSVSAEEGAASSYEVTFENGSVLQADENGQVSSDELKSVIEAIYGKRPVQRSLPATVTSYVTINGQAIKQVSQITVKATLVAPVIESAYYLVGDMVGWDDASMVKFNHSSSDVYDDPYFTLVFTATADNQYWKVIPQSNVDAGNIWADGVVGTVVDGDDSMTGSLVNENAQAGKIATAGMYKMTLNMMDYTYTLQTIDFVERIYIPGNHNGWSFGTVPALVCNDNDGDYKGLTYLDGDFKFTKALNWDNGEYNFNDFFSVSDGITKGSDTNINIAAGYYHIEANVSTGTLTATPVVWGLVGPATGAEWTPSNGPAMTYNSEEDCWEITTELSVGLWKFVANKDDSWAINLGASADDLQFNGDNLNCTEAGTYTIKLYTSRSTSDKMYCTVTKQ